MASPASPTALTQFEGLPSISKPADLHIGLSVSIMKFGHSLPAAPLSATRPPWALLQTHSADAGTKVPRRLPGASHVPICPSGRTAARRLPRCSYAIMAPATTPFTHRLNVSSEFRQGSGHAAGLVWCRAHKITPVCVRLGGVCFVGKFQAASRCFAEVMVSSRFDMHTLSVQKN